MRGEIVSSCFSIWSGKNSVTFWNFLLAGNGDNGYNNNMRLEITHNEKGQYKA